MATDKFVNIRGDNGWNDVGITLNTNDRLTIIPGTRGVVKNLLNAPFAFQGQVPASGEYDTNIPVKTGQTVKVRASGKWKNVKQTWEHTFQFDTPTGSDPDTTYGEGDWVPLANQNRAAYTENEGFEDVLKTDEPNGGYARLDQITITFAESVITSVEMTYDRSLPSQHESWGYINLTGVAQSSSPIDGHGSNLTRSIAGGFYTCNEIYLDGRVFVSNNPNDYGGSMTIKKVVVTGIGPNPFATNTTVANTTTGPDGVSGVDTTGFPLPSADAYSLIGKIGASGDWVSIGAEGEFVAPADGDLILAMNTDDYSGNTGSLAYKVELSVPADSVLDTGIAVQTGQTLSVNAKGNWQAQKWTRKFQFDTGSGSAPDTTYRDGGWLKTGISFFDKDGSGNPVDNPNNGIYVAGEGWRATPWNNYYHNQGWKYINIKRAFAAPIQITKVVMTYKTPNGSEYLSQWDNGIQIFEETGSDPHTRITYAQKDQSVSASPQTLTWEPSTPTEVNNICLLSTIGGSQYSGRVSGDTVILSCEIEGVGPNPFTGQDDIIDPDGDASVDNTGFPLETASAYSLIGKTGASGDWFAIGSNGTFTVPTGVSGNLYLAMNDDNYSDNSGSLSYTVQVNGGSNPPDCTDDPADEDEKHVLLADIPGVGSVEVGKRYDVTIGSNGPLKLSTKGCVNENTSAYILINGIGLPDNFGENCGANDICMPVSVACSPNPLQLAGGAKVVAATDLVLQSPAGQLTFARRFNQKRVIDGDTDYQFMGMGWSHNHQYAFSVTGTSPNRTATIKLPDGGALTLTEVASNQFEADSGSYATMEHDTGNNEYILTNPDRTTFVFDDSSFELKRRTWPNGEAWTYTHTGGNLTKVEDDYGRALNFSYYSGEVSPDDFKNGLLKTVSDHATTPRTIALDYVEEASGGTPTGSGDALLSKVTDVRGADWTYDYYGQNGGETDADKRNWLTQRISPDVGGNGTITLEELSYTVSSGDVTAINQKRGDNAVETDLKFTYDNGEATYTEEVFADGDANHELTSVHTFLDGRRLSTRNPEGQAGFETAGEDFRPAKQRDALGNETQLSWEADGKRLTDVVDAEGNSTAFGYNATDTLYRSVDAQNRRTLYLYESANAPRQPTHIFVGEPFDPVLLINGDMELNGNWAEVNAPTSNIQTTTEVDEGTYARYVNTDAAGEGIESDPFDLEANTSYLVVARVYTESGTVTMQLLNSGSSELKAITTSKTGEWETLVLVYVPSSAQNGATLRFLASGGAAEFYVDSVEINQLLRQQEFTYDSKGRTTEERLIDPSDGTSVLQKTARSFYTSGNGAGLLETMTVHDLDTPANNTSTTYTYDEAGRVVKTQKSSLFGSCEFSYTVYDAAGNVVATACGRESVTIPTTAQEARELYDDTDPSKFSITTHEYDELGRRYLTTLNDGDDSGQAPVDKQSSYTVFDALNRVVMSVSNYVAQANPPEDWVWDGNDKRWEDGSGNAIDHGTDLNENIISSTAFNKRGMVRQQIDVLGNVTLFGYDVAGRLIKTVQNASAPDYDNDYTTNGDPDLSEYTDDDSADQDMISTQAYDANGNLVQSINPLGQVSYTAYDALNRPVQVVRNARDEATLALNPGDVGYNVDNDPRSGNYVPSDAPDRDQIEMTEYDSLGRVIRSQRLKETRPNPVWDTTLFGYDSLGRQVKVVRHASDPDYDLNADPDLSGYAVSGESDEDQISTTTYDDQGRVQHTSDVNQTLTRLVYDGLNRQVKTISNYVAQSADPMNWSWDTTDERWEDAEDGTGSEIPLGDENDQNVISETVYDADGRVQSTRDALGRVTYTVYDTDGRVIRRISNHVAQATTPDQWEWRAVSSVYAWRLSDTNDTVVERRSDPTNHPNTHDQNIVSDTVYDEAGRIQQTMDVRGNLTRFVYDKLGRRIMSITNFVAQAQEPENWVWESGKWLVESAGSAVNRGADNDENVISFTRYVLAGRVDYTRDAVGLVTKNIYDKAGRRIRTIRNYVVQGASDPADWTWNTTAREWQYTAGSAVSHGTDFDQNIISDTTYNDGGQVIATRDARGTLTSFTYDNAGRRLTVTRADETDLATTDYTCYDKAGKVLRSIANYLEAEAHDLDAKDTNGDWVYVPNRFGTRNDRNRVTEFVYDNADRRVQVIDPLGNVTETTYFLDGQVDSMTHKDVAVNGTPTDVVTAYRYDKLRRRLVVVQNFVDNGEDPADWVWDAVTDDRWEESDGTAIVHGSENDTNVIVRVARDIAGRMTSLRDPRGNKTTYTYDQLNRRLTLTNPLSQVWTSAYSDLSDGLTRTTMTYPGLSSGGSYEVEREFDPLGRLASISYNDPSNTPDVVFDYDPAGNRASMKEYSNSGHTTLRRQTDFSYDAARRLTGVDFDTDGDTVVEESVTYEYDQGGLKTKMTLPGSLEVTYVYDSKGRLVGLTDWDDQPTSFFYDKADRHVGTVRSNGLTSDYLHDRAGRLLRLRHRAGQNLRAFFEYQVDARGNRVAAVERQVTTADGTLYGKDAGIVSYDAGTWTDDGSFKKSTQFSARMSIDWTGDEARMTIGTGPDHGIFDVYIGSSFWQSFDGYAASSGERVIHIPVDGDMEIRNRADHNRQSSGYVIRFKSLQLVNITEMDRDIAYTYDALSRLVEADYDSGTTIYDYGYDLAGNLVDLDGTSRTYNAANQMTNDGSNTLTYDANGNLVNDGVNAHTWDRANRMLTAPGGTSYKYDGLGNRIQQTVSSVVTDYLLDLQPGLTKVLRQDDGTDTNHFIHGPRGIHAQYDGTNWQYIAQDGLGSVRSIINSGLGVDAVQSYDPYGVPESSYGAGFGFTGEQTDANSQVYLRARYYNPSIGVFASLDPFEGMMDRAMSLNGYIWVEGNTPNMVDPTGKECESLDEKLSGTDGYWCNSLQSTLRSGFEMPSYDQVWFCYQCAMVDNGDRTPESYEQGLRQAERDGMASTERIERAVADYRRSYAEAIALSSVDIEGSYSILGVDINGYAEGWTGALSAIVASGQVGIEITYNFATFQRMRFVYEGYGGLLGNLVQGIKNVSAEVGLSASNYAGLITGFTPHKHCGAGDQYNHFTNEYTGAFIVNNLGAAIYGGGGAIEFHSPDGSIAGAGLYFSLGLGLDIGYSRVNYHRVYGSEKSFINPIDGKVNVEELTRDIIYGSGGLPSADLPLVETIRQEFRQKAATIAEHLATHYNSSVSASPCSC